MIMNVAFIDDGRELTEKEYQAVLAMWNVLAPDELPPLFLFDRLRGDRWCKNGLTVDVQVVTFQEGMCDV